MLPAVGTEFGRFQKSTDGEYLKAVASPHLRYIRRSDQNYLDHFLPEGALFASCFHLDNIWLPAIDGLASPEETTCIREAFGEAPTDEHFFMNAIMHSREIATFAAKDRTLSPDFLSFEASDAFFTMLRALKERLSVDLWHFVGCRSGLDSRFILP